MVWFFITRKCFFAFNLYNIVVSLVSWSCGLWRRVVLYDTNVSETHYASIFRVKVSEAV
jgi:hypothetical protein